MRKSFEDNDIRKKRGKRRRNQLDDQQHCCRINLNQSRLGAELFGRTFQFEDKKKKIFKYKKKLNFFV